MDSDLVVAWLLGLAVLVGIAVFFRMVWRSWKSGAGSPPLESTAADAEPLDALSGGPDTAPSHHHHHGGPHDSGDSGFGDHGFGHFDGGHHH